MVPYNTVGSLSLERTFLTNLLVSATYEINREAHRLRFRNLNAPLPDCVSLLPAKPTADAVRACRPDPTRGNLDSLESSAAELKHNLRLSYRHRFSIFQVTASYTYQRAYTGTRPNTPEHPTDNYDLRSDWGLGRQQPHNWNINLNAQLPLGVFLTARLQGNSGRKYSITTGRDDNRDGRFSDRPPCVEVTQAVCIGLDPDFTIPKHSETAPGSLRTDFNIAKAFFFGGNGMNVNFFANMRNAFNRVNLGVPSGVLTSPNFGRSTSASDPREITAGLRFQF